MSLPAKITIWFCIALYAFHGYRFLLALCQMAARRTPSPVRLSEVNPGFAIDLVATERDGIHIPSPSRFLSNGIDAEKAYASFCAELLKSRVAQQTSDVIDAAREVQRLQIERQVAKLKRVEELVNSARASVILHAADEAKRVATDVIASAEEGPRSIAGSSPAALTLSIDKPISFRGINPR